MKTVQVFFIKLGYYLQKNHVYKNFYWLNIIFVYKLQQSNCSMYHFKNNKFYWLNIDKYETFYWLDYIKFCLINHDIY